MPSDAPRLYLITPPISDWTPYPLLFEAAMAECDVACVLLRTAAQEEGEKENIVRALAPLVQKDGIACLVADDPQWAVHANADGVHIDGIGERLDAALRALKPGHIVGAGGLPTRDAAMAAGEAGADYVMFGGSAETHAQIVERVAWWAEIFNVPCVGYAHDLGAIGDLVWAGADFIALGDAVFADPRGAAAALRDVACLMAPTPEAAK
jgi:thiamine-phosphate pyrophosphorylase